MFTTKFFTLPKVKAAAQIRVLLAGQEHPDGTCGSDSLPMQRMSEATCQQHKVHLIHTE